MHNLTENTRLSKLILLIAILAVILPPYCVDLVSSYYDKPLICSGSFCEVDLLHSTNYDAKCGPWKVKHVIYPRIPKTGSTSILDLLKSSMNIKGIYMKGHLEWLDAAPRLIGKQKTPGYILSSTQGYKGKVRYDFFKKMADAVLFPNSRRGKLANYSFHEGHFFHLNWTDAIDMYRTPRFFKTRLSIAESLGIQKETSEYLENYFYPKPSLQELDQIAEIFFLRNPIDRLQSMYEFDRTSARSDAWRKRFVSERGTKLFEDCLVDPRCINKNELRRWCSIQTEFLCGLHDDCTRPLGKKALERAKRNIREKKIIVGTLENWNRSAKLLTRFLPRFFEGLEDKTLPKLKEGSTSRTREYWTTKANETVKELCSLDFEIYKFVSEWSSKKVEECGI